VNGFHKVHDSLLPLLFPIGDLVADPSNIMDHDERSISSIAESLDEYGQDIPLIAQAGDRVVKIGNGRLAAALRLGWTHVAVVFRTDDQITMIGRAVADNRTAQLSTWNKDFLSQAMDVLDQENHSKIGWMDDELSRVLNPIALEIPDEIPPGDPLDPAAPILDPGPQRGKGSLSERFGVPPFSVLDARQGYWQDRKRAWLELGIQSELGRGVAAPLASDEDSSKMAMHNDPMQRKAAYAASPGGSPRPAMKLKDGKTQRGDGRGDVICSNGGE